MVKCRVLTIFRIGEGGGGQKGPPISFSSVTSANVEISPRNCLTFSFKPFARLVYNFKSVLSASP